MSDLRKLVEKWVKQILEKQSYENVCCEFPDYDTTGGYGGEIIFVNVTAELNSQPIKLHLLVKRSKTSAVVLEDLGLRRIYLNEVNLYSKILPRLKSFAECKDVVGFENISNCYGTLIDGDHYVILLGNLKTQGFKLHDLKIPLNLDHAKITVKAYGAWHGLCLAFADQHPDEFDEITSSNQGINGTGIFRSIVVTIRKEIEEVAQLYLTKGIPKIAEKLRTLRDSYEELYETSMNPEKNFDRSVVRHGDCWNNNFLFHYAEEGTTPDKVVLIDWQLSIVASPLYDICHFLFFCCTKDELEHFDELLDLYYDTLSDKMRKLGSDPELYFPKVRLNEHLKKCCPVYVAGMLQVVRVSCTEELPPFDISEAAQGNIDGIMVGKIENPETYFDRLNGILSFCIERNFI